MKRWYPTVAIPIAFLFFLVSGTVSAADPEPPTFRQPPAVDTRAVLLQITKDKSAEVQIVVANPALNEGVSLSGEVIFRLPPGMVIYDSTGGSGGSGFHQTSIGEVKPGKNVVMPFHVMSNATGEMTLFSSITYWPQGNPDDANTTHSTFPIFVKEPSSPDSYAGAQATQVSEPAPAPAAVSAPAVTVAQGSTSFASQTDNPLGWSNWSFIVVFGGLFIALVFIALLFYKYVRSKSDSENW